MFLFLFFCSLFYNFLNQVGNEKVMYYNYNIICGTTNIFSVHAHRQIMFLGSDTGVSPSGFLSYRLVH